MFPLVLSTPWPVPTSCMRRLSSSCSDSSTPNKPHRHLRAEFPPWANMLSPQKGSGRTGAQHQATCWLSIAGVSPTAIQITKLIGEVWISKTDLEKETIFFSHEFFSSSHVTSVMKIETTPIKKCSNSFGFSMNLSYLPNKHVYLALTVENKWRSGDD